MKRKIKYIENLLTMIFSMIKLFFGYSYSPSIIPKGLYCYEPDDEKNKSCENFVYYIKTCKYYKRIGEWNGCQYLGIITDDFVFADKCKMCNKNYE